MQLRLIIGLAFLALMGAVAMRCGSSTLAPQPAKDEPALLAGTLERIELESETMYVRDGRSGLVIKVRMSRGDHRDQPFRLQDLRPGSSVSVSGTWDARGDFDGLRIESVDGKRG